MVTAGTALENYPGKKITMVKIEKEGLVPCGIPYIFGPTLGSTQKNCMPCGGPLQEAVETVIDEVQSVDIENKTATAKQHSFCYDKLVFATGSRPFVHKTLQPALKYENVFTVQKYKEQIERVKSYIDGVANVIVVGTGFIGVEIATELAGADKKVTIVGGRHVLAGSFDSDLAQKAQALMQDMGVELALGQHVQEILHEKDKALGVQLQDGTKLYGDAVILATGYRPNSDLAKDAGLLLTCYGGIWVDEYMRTQNKDIFAVGDCCARRDFITRDPSKVMLASTSAAEARVAGNSLYQLKYLKGFNGTIAIFSTMIAGRAFASAGVTEDRAQKENIDYVTGFFEGINRHPGTLKDASKQSVKLIALRQSGQIIGGQVVGDKEAGEIINIIGLAIEAELTAHNLEFLQVATQPLLTSAPTNYPIIKAAQQILQEECRR